MCLALLLALALDDPALPRAPAGWKVEVLARFPDLRHPTVVCASPDGRVFVGEDPQDMEGPVDAPLGRVVCIHPDGRRTVFAEKLGPVFGIEYLDGRVHVHALPRVVSFRDDGGVGRDPVEVLACTHPEPWRGNRFNTHIPAGFRLAMDGFFYMSVGDKGIFGAVGRDGKAAQLRGGGHFRFRPDGTGLEALSTGARNAMDLAVNAEDDAFAFDNDDNLHWPARVLHLVEGGDYGYPWQRGKPWVLPAMSEGRGIPAGGVAYDEAALPDEYRGNLFFCEWGRSRIDRLRVARDGATYRVVSREDFLVRGTEEFRPVGISVLPDGTGFLIADWNTPARLVKQDAGRLIRVTHPPRGEPLPAWFRSPRDAARDDLLRGLRHPARAVRLAAQRVLVERKAVDGLTALLEDRDAPPPARWHALWALDALGVQPTAMDPAVRIQALRQIGLRRGPVSADLLGDADAAVRFHAAVAMGRREDPAAVKPLLGALKDGDAFVRHAAARALNRIGRAKPEAWTAVAAALRDGTAAALHAMRETPEVAVVQALAGVPFRAETVAELAQLHRRHPAWDGRWWGTRAVLAPPPPKTEDYEGTPLVAKALLRALEDADPAVRKAAVAGVRLAKVGDAAAVLAPMFERDPDPEILLALEEFRSPATAGLAARVLAEPARHAAALPVAIRLAGTPAGLEAIAERETAPEVLVPVIEALASKRTGAAAVARSLRHPHVATLAAVALGRIGGPEAVAALIGALDDPALRTAATAALGETRAREAVGPLLKSGRNATTIRALAAIPDLRALDPYLEGLALKDPDVQAACRRALSEILPAALPALEARLESLSVPAVLELQRLLGAARPVRWWRVDGRVELAADSGVLNAVEAAATIESAREQDTALILAGLGSLTVRLNGKQVFERAGDFAFKANDARAAVRFRKGANELRVSSGAAFSVHLPPVESPILARRVERPSPEELLRHALENAGDAGRGRDLFRGAACIRCHAVRGEGGDIGPELSMVGGLYDRRYLAESVLWPSKVVVGGFRQIVVQTPGGSIHTGAIKSETAEHLVLQEAEGARHRFEKAGLLMRRSDLSLMPEGLAAGLTPAEFADLVAFLESLKGLE